MLRSLVFGALALGAGASQACRVAPPAQRIAAEDQVRQPADVMVGQVIGAAPTWRSFEKIDMVDGHPDPEDKWLAYVKTALSGTPVRQDYERIGRLIYGLQRMQAQGDFDRQALAAQHAPDQLLMRAGRLADEYERILKEPKEAHRIPDQKIDATLREAASLHAALETWRNGAAR